MRATGPSNDSLAMKNGLTFSASLVRYAVDVGSAAKTGVEERLFASSRRGHCGRSLRRCGKNLSESPPQFVNGIHSAPMLSWDSRSGRPPDFRSDHQSSGAPNPEATEGMTFLFSGPVPSNCESG